MRRTWIGVVVLGLMAAAPARAGEAAAARPATAASPAKKAVKPTEAETTKKTETEKSEKEASTLALQQLRELLLEQAKELEAQRAAMREQQLKMEALEEKLREVHSSSESAATTPAGAPGSLSAVAADQDELGNRVSKIEKDLADTKNSVESKIKGFGPFTFSGDLRVRYEPFFGGGALSSPAPVDRHRERFRLRLNANAKLNDEFSGGLSIASGDTGDPISTNQTMTNFFQRKPILIDRAFVNYNPRWWKPFQVTAGKWAYPWYRTELTWDNDLNPEGFSEAVHYNWKNSFLQHLGIVAFQLPVFEVANAPDTAVFGGQVQTNWKLHDRLKFGAYVGYYDYRKPNSIAANQGSGTGSTGFLAGNSNTNSFGVIGGSRIFASKFGILDAIAKLDIDTGISRFPLMLLFDFAQNTQACSNLGAFTSAEVTAPFCDPHARHGYWSEIQFGRTQEKGDVRFGYTFIRIEREAVVSAFSFSDLRQATNVANHRIEVLYQAYRNITLGFTGLIGRQLVTATSPTTTVSPERWLKRLQFDLTYKF